MKARLLKSLRKQALSNLDFIGSWSGYWRTKIDGKIFKSSIVSGFGAVIGNDKGFTRECISRSIAIKRGYSVDNYVILK